MKVQFCGAAKSVTGSCYFVDTGTVKFLVDCGAFQGNWEEEKLNHEPFPFDPASIEYVFLTHAHFDHCGRLPILVKQGFKGRIIATQPTRDLAKIVLMDAAKLQEEGFKRWSSKVKRGEIYQEAPKEGSLFEKREPLFTEQDVEQLFTLFDLYPYSDSVDLHNGVEYRLRDAGHILGSCIFEFWIKNDAGRVRKLVFSGDIGQQGERIVRDPDLIREADFVFIESTYGNRLHKNKDETLLEFLSILKDSQTHGGNILIPSFAIERTQEVIYELNLFVQNRLLTGLPVYLDSPMASKATAVFRQYPSFYDEDATRQLEKGTDPFAFEGLHEIETTEESKRLIEKRGVVIIAGSGMCTGGRIVHHLENNIQNAKTHVLFVGFQVEGTLGRQLIDGAPQVKIRGKMYDVRAKIHTLGGFSAHADRDDLVYWLRSFGHSPQKVFIMHGEASICEEFSAHIRNELNLETHIPNLFEEVVLE
ncbi:MBL fold metallo-hydrolase [Candidatus Dojkabacteria bacterium]|nr:MBL fold metallo-hydrolase [Candidatus Dojkabacteria bacterium]